MAAVVRTFNYTGTLQEATIPPGTTSIDVHLWGGAGGGGGADAGGPGGTGAAGHSVTSSGISISSSQTKYLSTKLLQVSKFKNIVCLFVNRGSPRF